MSDSKEKSDDLIAELAKLMASDAQGSETAPKPSVIKLPPLGAASVPSPSPVRIPGMDAGKPGGGSQSTFSAPNPAAPSVRIPGLEKPAGISDAPPQQPRSGAQFDMSRPVTPSAPAGTPPSPAPAPAAMPAPPEAKPVSTERPTEAPALRDSASAAAPATTSREPNVGLQSAASAGGGADRSASQETRGAELGSGFNFDFGLNSGQRDGRQQSGAQASDDPIADLITAELDASDVETGSGEREMAAPAPVQAPRPPPAPHVEAFAAPAKVTAVPARQIGVTPRGSDSDRFTVAPVFDSGSRTSSGAGPAPVSAPMSPGSATGASGMTPRQREELDPIDEIESLIGDAVRGDRPASNTSKPRPDTYTAPAVPPAGTSFAPRRAGIRETTNHAHSAEDAIMAAAAASGAEVGRLDAPEAEERPYRRMKVKPPRTSFVPSGARQYVGIAVAGTLLLAAGFGLYWVLGMGGGDDPSTAPVLTADASPAKVEPAETPAADEPSGSVVFNELADAGSSEPTTIETLVSRDETAGSSPTEVARAVSPSADQPTTESGLANRKVRTVTVRPDGTIVAADDAVAGSEALPVERPNVPQIEGEAIEPSELLSAAVAESEAGAEPASRTADSVSALVSETGNAATAPLDGPAPLEVAALPATDGVQAVFDGSLTAPVPMPRPLNRDALVGGTGRTTVIGTPASSVNQPASTPLVAVTQNNSAPAVGNSRAYVQLASLPSEQDAQTQIRAQTSRFGSLFSGTSLEVRRVDLGAKGVWYRVVLPVSSFQEATQTCAAIKANGGDCIPNNG